MSSWVEKYKRVQGVEPNFLGELSNQFLSCMSCADDRYLHHFWVAKSLKLGKLCFTKTKFEPNLSCFSGPGSAPNFAISEKKIHEEKIQILKEYL